MESGMGQMVAEGADINSSNLCREGKVAALKQKRRLDAERREQLLYQRAYTPENYGKDGLEFQSPTPASYKACPATPASPAPGCW